MKPICFRCGCQINKEAGFAIKEVDGEQDRPLCLDCYGVEEHKERMMPYPTDYAIQIAKLRQIRQWDDQIAEERRIHPGEKQCWHCKEWHADDPNLEDCPHCGKSIWPF